MVNIETVLQNISEDLGLPEPNLDWSKNLPVLVKDQVSQCVKRSHITGIVSFAMEKMDQGQTVEAVNCFAISLLAHEDKATKTIQESGALRLSKHDFRTANLLKTARILSKLAVQLKIKTETRDYFASVSNLLAAGRDIELIVERLREKVQSNPDTFLKSVVAVADSLFMEPGSLPGQIPRQYTIEDLAEGASFLVHLFSLEHPVSPDKFSFIDEKGVSSGTYHRLLAHAAKVRAFMESEVLIDQFGYRSIKRGSDVRVIPNGDSFEKSVRLGYILNDQARASAHAGALASVGKDEEPQSIFRFADYAYDKFGKEVVRYEELPMRRITLRFSHKFLSKGLQGLSGFTLEEYLNLFEAQRAELLTWEEMEKVQILKDLPALDLIGVFRFFAFMARFLEREIRNLPEDQSILGYRSLLPVFSMSNLSQIIVSLLPGSTPEKVTKVIELLSSNLTAGGIFDIQYTPIIRAGDSVLLPLNIIARMNWWRNISQTQKLRAIEYAEEEAASRLLHKALDGIADEVEKGFETTLGGKHFELDVVARMDDHLFIFECKHPLVPCNAFELRTSFNHVKKGSDQLSKTVQLLSEEKHEHELYRRLGWNCGPAQNISTCIVSCNGMFSGFRADGNPVRRMHELCNYIETGKIRVAEVIRSPSQQTPADIVVKEVDVWGGEYPQLTADLLWEYLAKDKLVKPIFDAMESYSKVHTLKKRNLVFSTFALDALKLSEFYFSNSPSQSDGYGK